MRVSCFCGMGWEADADHAHCPLCGELAYLPRVSQVDADAMLGELQRLLDAHGVIDG